MNPTIETILNRRSIRSYAATPLPETELNAILECGNAAPSGGANRNWRFAIVQSEKIRSKLKIAAKPLYEAWLKTMPPSFLELRAKLGGSAKDPIYYDAPVIVFVIGWGKTCDFDTPMVCQNMMLAARSLGIGSLWTFTGQLVCREPEVKTLLGLKDEEKIFGPILLGYPSGEFPEAPKLNVPRVLNL